MADLEEQPVPKESRCPECGGEPREDDVLHRLSALGYLHDDIGLVCRECKTEWTCGVPIGEFDRDDLADDLWCDSCEDTVMLVHRVEINPPLTAGNIGLHLKCPNPECRYFEIVGRESDDDGRALVGYDLLAGQTEGAEPYGYPEVTDADDE